MRIMGPTDGEVSDGPRSKRRQLISAADVGGRWSLGEVTAEPDETVLTHIQPGEPEAFVILDGDVELHGAKGGDSAAARRCGVHSARYRARPPHPDRWPLAGDLAGPRARARHAIWVVRRLV